MYSNSFAHFFPNGHFSKVNPTPVANPKLLGWSPEAATLVDLKPTDEIVQVLSGNKTLPGMEPIATRYGGHQFGHWAGQLGDGRAIILGERNGYEIQLKGAGLTPYSRSGDGRAVLRSSLREYVCSEAMYFLGIPTTRALALTSTGEDVIRDMFYDGHPAPEPGAICTRLAPSFIRFGHFEILAADNNVSGLKKLVEYTLSFYPDHNLETFFEELCRRTAKLMVDWLRVGFVHGVMNTDNMSFLGLTIDYGPYGWLDVYDPGWTPNTTDKHSRRYTFGQQPGVALWNLERLADAFSVLGVNLAPILDVYENVFLEGYLSMMAAKLGLSTAKPELIKDLDLLMRAQETDMTIFYRGLSEITEDGPLPDAFYQDLSAENKSQWDRWIVQWRLEIKENSTSESRARMKRVNPAFVARNYLAQEAIDAIANGDDSKLKALELALRKPYEVVDPALCKKRPEWARSKAGCSALSCSS